MLHHVPWLGSTSCAGRHTGKVLCFCIATRALRSRIRYLKSVICWRRRFYIPEVLRLEGTSGAHLEVGSCQQLVLQLGAKATQRSPSDLQQWMLCSREILAGIRFTAARTCRCQSIRRGTNAAHQAFASALALAMLSPEHASFESSPRVMCYMIRSFGISSRLSASGRLSFEDRPEVQPPWLLLHHDGLKTFGQLQGLALPTF